eukprot:scaffold122801_cov44-Attheya_sp.AAC.1
MARVYDLVMRHFIASVSPDAVWCVTRVQLEIEILGKEGHFTISGKKVGTKTMRSPPESRQKAHPI